MTASDPLVRMLTLLPWLRARGPVDVGEVADHFGITEAHLLDELAILTFVGPGQGGGELVDISYEDGHIAVHDAQGLEFPLRLNAAEAASLLTGLTLLTELVPSGATTDPAASALAKLEQAAGEALAGAGALVVTVAHADPEVEAAVRSGLQSHRRLRIEYVAAAREDLTDRAVDPLRLIAVDGRTYLEGWCHRAGGVRTFRLDRIVSAVVTDEAAEPPEGAVGESAGSMLPEGVDVRVHLARTASHVTELRACVSHQTLPDGTFDATLRVADARWLVRLLLSLGPEGRVVDSPELADLATERAREALAAYGE